MINYGKQSICEEDINAVIEILKGDWLTQGPTIELFEEELKTFFGAKYCSVVSNGTAALHLAGIALGWKPGDIVITTPLTFLATANSILYSGATPDFVDINPITYNIDVVHLEKKIKTLKSQNKKVKAIIAVDYAGHPCEWKELRSLSDKYELQLINDNCHALGATYLDSRRYATKYADLVIQSYHPVKNFTTGEGGSILTNDLELDKKVKSLRSHGITKNKSEFEQDSGPWYYEMQELGYNYRITDLQCALGLSQLRKLSDFVKKRQQIARIYDEAFANNDAFIIPEVSESVGHAYHLYPLQIKFGNLGKDKKYLFKELKKNGVIPQVHYIPIHIQPYYARKFGFKRGDFPKVIEFYDREVSLPIYPDLNDTDVAKVIDLIKSIDD